MINETLKTIMPGYGLASLLAEQLLESNKNSKEILDTNDEKKITLELKRKKVETEILELEAKVAQELAISKRIENAEVVEIEEYYEGSGKGNAGASVDENSFKFGLAGEGKKITKRIYRFTGFRNE
jgi:hypothetical protein